MRKTSGMPCSLLIAAATVALAAGRAPAECTLTTLASFHYNDGAYPYAGLILSGNTLYGTTSGGTAAGTVFSLPLAGGTPTVLASFNGPNGSFPEAGVTLSGNTLYGTTYFGGAGTFGDGTAFSVPLAGGTPTALATFNNASGESPMAGLTVSGNTLYGTTTSGGPGGFGTVFSLPTSGGTPTVLTSFSLGGPNYPQGGLTLSGSTLYGTTKFGGNGYGTVLSLPLTGGTPTVLASFNGANGVYPCASLILSGNTLYGTTNSGGANSPPGNPYGGAGTVFSVPVTGGTPTVLASFNGTNGSGPGELILSGNTLYGTTQYGGAYGLGAVYSVPIAGGTPTILASFGGPNGKYPEGGMVLSGNMLYGVTKQGGANGAGVIFALDPSTTSTGPIINLTLTAPSALGSQVGTLSVIGGPNSATCTPTPTAYLAVTGFNHSSDKELYALHITDAVSANLAADLADAAWEINSGRYSGYSLTASTIDSTGTFGSGYDFFLTVTGSTLGTTSPYFGFDFTQLNGIGNTLSVDTVVSKVPEPATLGLLALGALGLLARRRRGNN